MVGMMKPISESVAKNIGEFAEELNKVSSKFRTTGENISKMKKAAIQLRNDYVSNGRELAVSDEAGVVYDLYDFTPVGHESTGLTWQWRSRV